MPDFNRDGNINNDDRGKVTATDPWRFWVNDETDLNEPLNWPDKLCSNKVFAFVHGYSVSEKSARDWNAEMFKRMYWSGSKAKYVGVCWRGNEGQIVPILPKVGGTTPDYWVNVKNAFWTAEALKNGLANLPGPKYVAAHSLGNMVVSSAMVDKSMGVSKYFMINAAVAREAYNPMHVDHSKMANPEWRDDYPSSVWSPYFHQLFDIPDARRKLTWIGRFSGIQNVHQFYSSGENVLEVNADGNKPSIPGILLKQRKAWVAQEMDKGTATKVVIEFLGELLDGKLGNWDIGARGGWGESGSPVPTTRDEKIVNPYFKKFSEGTLHQVAANGAAAAADFRIRSRLLAEEIPALSWPAGSQPVEGFAKTDLISLWKNVTEDLEAIRRPLSPGAPPPWWHSDIKDISFMHTHPFFDEVVRIGNLKQ